MSRQFFTRVMVTSWLVLFSLFFGQTGFGQVYINQSPNKPYFELNYKKNQDVGYQLRFVDLNSLPPVVNQGKFDLLSQLTLNEPILPYVNYNIDDNKRLNQYLDQQYKKALVNFKIKSSSQIDTKKYIELVAYITSQNLEYDSKMVQSSKDYDSTYDDYISNLSLDKLIIDEKKGVCRQYSVVFDYIANYLKNKKELAKYKDIFIGQIISYDYNHAYNVLVMPTKSPNTYSAAFIDITQEGNKFVFKSLDASGSSYDSLFSFLIKDGYWSWEPGQEEEILNDLTLFKQQGQISYYQAQTELLNIYNEKLLAVVNQNQPNIDQYLALSNKIESVSNDLGQNITKIKNKNIINNYRQSLASYQALQQVSFQKAIVKN